MKVLIINTVCGVGSTGRIAAEQAERYIKDGHECVIAYGRDKAPEDLKSISYRLGTETDVRINALKARLFDNEAFNAKAETKRFIKWANNYDPDIVCLHNLHGYYINIELLFDWIKSRPHMEVTWTLHDCWSFTGHCSHFSFVGCEKWKTGCFACSQKGRYPASVLADASRSNYLKKKRCFSGVSNMTVVVPSRWLSDLAEKSFLGQYPIKVVHNSVNKEIFKPTESDFRKKHGLDGKKIILGVASAWDDRKGLYDFAQLAERLDSTFKVVLVGLTREQSEKMPCEILSIPRTDSVRELAEIYSAADVFVNPSREETFGLTTLEALSCGTFPIVYKNTACEEVVATYGGMAVEGNVDALVSTIYDSVPRELKEESYN